MPAQVPMQAPSQAPAQAPTQAPTQAPSQAPTPVPTRAPPQAMIPPSADAFDRPLPSTLELAAALLGTFYSDADPSSACVSSGGGLPTRANIRLYVDGTHYAKLSPARLRALKTGDCAVFLPGGSNAEFDFTDFGMHPVYLPFADEPINAARCLAQLKLLMSHRRPPRRPRRRRRARQRRPGRAPWQRPHRAGDSGVCQESCSTAPVWDSSAPAHASTGLRRRDAAPLSALPLLHLWDSPLPALVVRGPCFLAAVREDR
jgi:hypothetical protein